MVAPPIRRMAAKLWTLCIGDSFLPRRCGSLGAGGYGGFDRPRSEVHLESAEEAAARSELRSKDPEPAAIADLVLLVPQVGDVEARLELAHPGHVDTVRDADVGGLVGPDGGVVRVDDAAPEPAAFQEVQAETRVSPEVGGADGSRDE